MENEESIRRALAAGLPGIEEGWLRKLFEGRTDSNEEMRRMWELLLPLYFDDPFDPSLPKEMAERTYFHHQTHNSRSASTTRATTSGRCSAGSACRRS